MSSEPGEANLAPVVILAEDDHDIRTMLSLLLMADGYVVESARDGTELSACLARRAERGRRPDLVVTDHHMPGPHIFDALPDLRAADSPPVIVITACSDGVEADARRFGAKAIFHKPFDLDDFRTAVWHWAGRGGQRS